MLQALLGDEERIAHPSQHVRDRAIRLSYACGPRHIQFELQSCSAIDDTQSSRHSVRRPTNRRTYHSQRRSRKGSPGCVPAAMVVAAPPGPNAPLQLSRFAAPFVSFSRAGQVMRSGIRYHRSTERGSSTQRLVELASSSRMAPPSIYRRLCDAVCRTDCLPRPPLPLQRQRKTPLARAGCWCGLSLHSSPCCVLALSMTVRSTLSRYKHC